MITIIVRFFNIVLDTGCIPTDWCAGIIIPIYKNKGDAADPDNYRGITLLSCLGKLFTSILNLRLTKFFNLNCLIGKEQAGFRASYSTTDHVFVLKCIIDIYLQQNRRLYCGFIDYKKAFDFIDRYSLWQKLLKNGVSGKIFNVIKNIYQQAKSCVNVKGNLSQYFTCNVGVRQGENLSPLLFAIYLNDFDSYIGSCYEGLKYLASEMRSKVLDTFVNLYCLLYADDTIILAESSDQLQSALDAVNDYCQKWKLTVNTSKTKIVIFSRGKVRKIPIFNFRGDVLEVVDDFIYLGVRFKYNGTFKLTVTKQVSQARKALYSLLAKAKRLHLSIDTQCELFDRMILPILTYGCEVWGYEDIAQIEIFHRKFLRTILRV